MRFLVLGCNGMAGHTISLYLKERGHFVLGFDKNKSLYINSIAGDALNFNGLKEIILTNNFDSIVNCIGVLNKAAEDNKALATYLNSFLPNFLADITKDTNIQVIHMSTDCVFSGNKGSYSEKDIPDGQSFYDRSKALGELNDNKNITLRNSIVGPDINPNGIGLFNWFMAQFNEINGYTKAMWTGVTTLQLAKIIEYVSKNRSCGLINSVPCNSISKYDLLQLFNKYFKNNSLKINPSSALIIDKSLIRTNFDIDIFIPNYDTMIKELYDWIYKHREMYPHYHIDEV